MLRTDEKNILLDDVFNRLRGELSLHGFTVRERVVPLAPSEDILQKIGEEEKAVASLYFPPPSAAAEKGKEAVLKVQIELEDRVTGKWLKRQLILEANDDTASIMAARGVEILRASLLEFSESPPTETNQEAHPELASKAVKEISLPRKDPEAWYLSVGMMGELSYPTASWSLGPSLQLAYHWKSWGARLYFGGPLLGGKLQSEFTSADYWSIQARAEALWILRIDPSMELMLFPSLGTVLLNVNGSSDLPYRGVSDNAWYFNLGGGAEFNYLFSDSIAVGFSTRLSALLPSARVQLGDSSQSLGAPLLDMTLSLRFRL